MRAALADAKQYEPPMDASPPILRLYQSLEVEDAACEE